jgi:putative aldouronate transport system permease protein
MAIRISKGERVFALCNFSFLTLLTLIILYPLIHVAFASFSDPEQMVGYRGILLAPKGLSLKAYKLVLTNPMILSGYLNTLFILVVGTSLNMVLTILGAFVLTRKNLLFKNFFVMFILITMLFQGGLIPLYRVVYSLHLANSLWAMILPVSINTWNLIVMRSFFATIPDSLEESAKIDGANDLVVLIKIILPLSLPVLAVIGLFYGVYHWNAWFNAMIYTRNRALYPLQLVLREILIANDLNNMMSNVSSADQAPIGATIKYATIMVSTVPILFVYPFLQRFFVKGLVIGAVKG